MIECWFFASNFVFLSARTQLFIWILKILWTWDSPKCYLLILKLINLELLHAAGTIVKLPTNYNFHYLHSKKAHDSLLSKAILWFLFFKCISSLFPPFMLTLWILLSFDTRAFAKNIFLGHFKAFLILKFSSDVLLLLLMRPQILCII